MPVIEKAKKACENSGQEVLEHFAHVSEPQKSRNQYGDIKGQLLEDYTLSRYACYLIAHNKQLAHAAKEAGVINYANFQDFGYMGLYGNMRQKDIHAKKNLKKNEAILDHMNSEELAANLFRATQAEAKLKRENITGQEKANQAHFDVGKKVRQTIKELGGTMPENLPTPEDIKESKKRLKNTTKKSLQKNS